MTHLLLPITCSAILINNVNFLLIPITIRSDEVYGCLFVTQVIYFIAIIILEALPSV